ncbi:CHAT domain-containing protein [Streptomyces sp. NBC_00289]|uniref:CHAT domain-containing protein n=1 Tax=Streptomyces sp. NBC_00289 TaxID=2975703 RepID=UPI003246F22B
MVVPDGPLALVPFAGLRLTGSQPLAECATTVFFPGLSLLAPPGAQPRPQGAAARRAGPPSAPGRVIAHAAAPMFTERLTTLVEQAPLPVTVSEPMNRAELREALLTATAHDVAVLFHHGDTAPDSASRGVRLADGGYLSATTARRWNWPDTVVLGSCWAAHLLPTEADEPFGLPTACLLGGARSVIGGQAPILANKTVATVIARVVVNSAQGERAAERLGTALSTLSRTAGVNPGPAAGWAGLTCWTTDPPPAAHRVADAWTPRTSHSTDEQPDVQGLPMSCARSAAPGPRRHNAWAAI